MKAKSSKMLALAVIIGLCAVAIVGAAYAAFTGTASTYNENNAADTGYMTLSPDGEANTAAKWAAISTTANKEVFSTYSYVVVSNTTYTDKVAYYFKEGGAAGTGIAADYIVKPIASKDFVVANNSGSGITAINFKATSNAAAPAGDFVYFLKVTIGETVTYLAISGSLEQTTAKAITIADGDSEEISVAICIGYDPNVTIPASHIGTATSTANDNARESANAPVDLSNMSFAFEVVDAS